MARDTGKAVVLGVTVGTAVLFGMEVLWPIIKDPSQRFPDEPPPDWAERQSAVDAFITFNVAMGLASASVYYSLKALRLFYESGELPSEEEIFREE